jgi:hypothetical protein
MSSFLVPISQARRYWRAESLSMAGRWPLRSHPQPQTSTPFAQKPLAQTSNPQLLRSIFDTRFLLSGVPLLTLPIFNAAKPFGSGV